MLEQRQHLEGDAFSDAADWRALEEKLGSPEDATAVGSSAFAGAVAGVQSLAQLRDFVVHFQGEILAKNELPIILRAYHHAVKNEARELIALDQSLQGTFANKALANASEVVGRNQLRRLRALKDQRVVTRYWNAVHAKQASGWHTIVFGVVLAVYSIPLRQGLHHYSRQTIHGFLEAGAMSLRLPQAEANDLEAALGASIPVLVEQALAPQAVELRCV